MDGSHSDNFQAPFAPPLSCPIRITTDCTTLRSAAISRRRSATHFDSVYPAPTATLAAIGTSLGYVVSL